MVLVQLLAALHLASTFFLFFWVPRAPKVFVDPRTLLATRVPPLAAEQWQLYHIRLATKVWGQTS